MTRRRMLLVGMATAAVALSGTAAALSTIGAAGGRQGGSGPEDLARATAEVGRRDLEEQVRLGGTLGYGTPTPLTLPNSGDLADGSAAGAGTVTALPAVGTVVGRGDTLFEVDGRTVPLLYGDRPLWRPLQRHDEDGRVLPDGPDVEQLEANLVALGFATDAELTVDQGWTAVTTQVVKRWQESLGREATGTVAPDEAVMWPGPLRVDSVAVDLGAPAAGHLLDVTGTDRKVTVTLAPDRRDLLPVGAPVEVELPDGTVVDGEVETVADTGVGEEGEGDDATLEVTVRLDPDAETDSADPSTVAVAVGVIVTVSRAEGVVVVPVEALLALAEGGYAVEVPGDDGTTGLVPVEVGTYADGWVELTEASLGDDLAVGDDVVVPA